MYVGSSRQYCQRTFCPQSTTPNSINAEVAASSLEHNPPALNRLPVEQQHLCSDAVYQSNDTLCFSSPYGSGNESILRFSHLARSDGSRRWATQSRADAPHGTPTTVCDLLASTEIVPRSEGTRIAACSRLCETKTTVTVFNVAVPIAFWSWLDDAHKTECRPCFSPANPRLDSKVRKCWGRLHNPHQPTRNASNRARPPGMGVSPTAPCFSCHGSVRSIKTMRQLATPGHPSVSSKQHKAVTDSSLVDRAKVLQIL